MGRNIFRFVILYFLCTLLGWIFLQLPFCKKTEVSSLDALFTVVSAISTTGLASVDIGEAFSFVGQLLLLILIQVGGVAYLVVNAYLIVNIARTEPPAQQDFEAGEFTLKKLIYHALVFTAICEAIGSGILYFIFKHLSLADPLWNGVFHAVSAFCTAGLSLFSMSFENYYGHVGINLTLSILSLWGSLGFFLWIAVIKKISGKKAVCRFFARAFGSFTFIVILSGSILLLLAGSFAAQFSGFEKMLIVFFQTMSAVSTAGFSTINVATLSQTALITLTILMLYGGILTGSCLNMRRGAEGQRLIKKAQVVLFSIASYFLLTLGSTLLLSFSEKAPFFALLFEVVSAMSAVGLSMGITAELSPFGKGLILFLMFTGRMGILLLGFLLASRLFVNRSDAKMPITIR